jgi:hypothetical protein
LGLTIVEDTPTCGPFQPMKPIGFAVVSAMNVTPKFRKLF